MAEPHPGVGDPRRDVLLGAERQKPGLLVTFLDQAQGEARCLRREEVAQELPVDGVLLNRYRSGRDSMGWHADNEPEFGPDPVIASVSFGGTRTFQLKHQTRKDLKTSLLLTHGSLLLMRGGTQENWLHQVPKTARAVDERLNLTFRRIINLAE